MMSTVRFDRELIFRRYENKLRKTKACANTQNVQPIAGLKISCSKKWTSGEKNSVRFQLSCLSFYRSLCRLRENSFRQSLDCSKYLRIVVFNAHPTTSKFNVCQRTGISRILYDIKLNGKLNIKYFGCGHLICHFDRSFRDFLIRSFVHFRFFSLFLCSLRL